MKTKDLLKEIVKAYPDVVAIARDFNGDVYAYYKQFPYNTTMTWTSNKFQKINFEQIIEWDSENWKENIVTINDLQNEEL